MNRPLTYLATPYSAPDKPADEQAIIKVNRYELVTRAAAWLMERYRVNVFSPITHSHPLHVIAGLRGDWEFWKKVDTEYLECSARIVILVVPGWDTSIGVTAEHKIAQEMKLPVFYLHPLGGNEFRLTTGPGLMDDEIKLDLDGEYEGCVR